MAKRPKPPVRYRAELVFEGPDAGGQVTKPETPEQRAARLKRESYTRNKERQQILKARFKAAMSAAMERACWLSAEQVANTRGRDIAFDVAVEYDGLHKSVRYLLTDVVCIQNLTRSVKTRSYIVPALPNVYRLVKDRDVSIPPDFTQGLPDDFFARKEGHGRVEAALEDDPALEAACQAKWAAIRDKMRTEGKSQAEIGAAELRFLIECRHDEKTRKS